MNWLDLPFFSSPEWEKLNAYLKQRHSEANIYPPAELRFRAFELTPLDQTNLLILGQDPYHRPQQAHGLCFSVPQGTKAPPSLRNILKEAGRDLGLADAPPRSTDLSDWAKQGVLLINTSLSVEEGLPGSHANKGWEKLTLQVIQTLSNLRPHVVFMLWGNPARSYAKHIAPRHTILETVHPSPLSAFRGFHGCGHFSAANQALTAHGQPPIRWIT